MCNLEVLKKKIITDIYILNQKTVEILGLLLMKESMETLTGHLESRVKQQLTYLRVCKCMVEQGQRGGKRCLELQRTEGCEET